MIYPKVDTVIRSDVLVVGGGLAGCFAALAAREGGAEVVLADKGWISRSGQSPFAAGIFTVFDPREDDFDVWMNEIVTAGEYLNDQEWVKLLFEQTYPLATQLDHWGQEYRWLIFEKDEKGGFLRRRSRGHINTKHNVVNSLPMMDALRKKLKERGVRLVEKVMVTDLVVEDGRALGAVGFSSQEKKVYLFLSRATILAASGCGFKSIFVGHRNLTGDLQAAAGDAGVIFQNMENNASNTCARDFDIHGLNLYVGVGGKFLNSQGEEFMWRYNPALGNRARLQDLVIAFCQEVAAGRGPIYLDMSAASVSDQALCRKILPESFMLWDRASINPFQQKVEWVPAFYGTIVSGGGISINLKGETNLPGLYAAGDITNEPPHGTYSFGGINLCFAVVSGNVAGRNAVEFYQDIPLADGRKSRQLVGDVLFRRLLPITRKDGVKPDGVMTKVQEAVIPSRYGYLKTEENLLEAKQKLIEIEQEWVPRLRAATPHELLKCYEAANMARVGRMMVEAGLVRKESRGFHFRVDHPRTDNVNWLKWVRLKKEGDQIKAWTEDVPTPYVRPKEAYSIPPGLPHMEQVASGEKPN